VVLTLVQPTAAPRLTPTNAALFVAVAEACGWDTHRLTESARGQLNRAAKELAHIDATPDEIRAKGAAYRIQYPGMPLTPPALTKHWPGLMVVEREPEAAYDSGPPLVPDADGQEHLARLTADLGRMDYDAPAAKVAASPPDGDIPY
jgi:hypothetical protein